MENDDTDSDEPQRSSFPSPFPVSVPRRSRSRDPLLSRPNPNRTHDDDDDDRLPEEKKKKRRSEEIWSERSIAALLEVWGERFVRQGRRSLRAEEWSDVAESLGRTESECRTALGSLKTRFRAERDRAESSGRPSAWGFFAKMESLLSSDSAAGGLACGFDSGEFVFADMRAYLDHATGLDEMGDSPGESEASGGSDSEEASGIGELAESVERLREIYGRVERDKRRQMVELEKMRRHCQRELELQKRHIMETACAEIAQIRSGHDHRA